MFDISIPYMCVLWNMVYHGLAMNIPSMWLLQGISTPTVDSTVPPWRCSNSPRASSARTWGRGGGDLMGIEETQKKNLAMEKHMKEHEVSYLTIFWNTYVNTHYKIGLNKLWREVDCDS